MLPYTLHIELCSLLKPGLSTAEINSQFIGTCGLHRSCIGKGMAEAEHGGQFACDFLSFPARLSPL